MERASRHSLALTLADGARWLIQAKDEPAARIAARLGEAMGLRPGPGPGRRLLVATDGGSARPLPDTAAPPHGDRPPVVCVLYPGVSRDMLVTQLVALSLTIARDAQARGGVLLHGALAEIPAAAGEGGIILAGPGTVGKTTASRRLPSPWRPLSDDTALVVRGRHGGYWAHPWPTWSRFYGGGPGGSWDVQRAVPLRAVFFLSQSPEDRVSPVEPSQAIAGLMASVQQVSGPMTRRLSDDDARIVHQQQLAAVIGLARAVPTYSLHLSLNGPFWNEIERVLSDSGSQTAAACGVIREPAIVAAKHRLNDATSSTVVYTGPSMNPTLREPDLLEVVEYDGRPVRRGDVVYCRPSSGERPVVHRVVRITEDGIRTRGDNNPADRQLVQLSDIVGQVVAAQRGRKVRRIAGGWRGRVAGTRARWNRSFLRSGGRVLRGAYRGLAKMGIFQRLLPVALRPRVVTFTGKSRVSRKLMIARHVIGTFDAARQDWRIRPPFRLFVDESVLCRPQVERSRLPGRATRPEQSE